MKAGRLVALLVGCALLLPGLGMLLGGGGLGLAYAFGRDDAGYFRVTLDRLQSPTVAVTAEEVDLTADPGTPSWLIDAIEADVRLRATASDARKEVFIGIGRERDVDAYLSGVAHDEIVRLEDGNRAEFLSRSGGDVVAPPGDQKFWTASVAGAGTQQLDWEATSGEWAVVVMNSDGSRGVDVDTSVGVKSDAIVPVLLGLIGLGALISLGASVMIVGAALGGRDRATSHDASAGSSSIIGPQPATRLQGEDPGSASPVRLNAQLDPQLSRWKWMVKWFLAIPHFIALLFLWAAFVVLTIVAGFSILFTGVYPRRIFTFNEGVLRWSWRVAFYATSGGIGTDAYPPFTLAHDERYPATLTISYPERLSRGLVLVKWWLLAIPHYLILGLLVGGSFRGFDGNGDGVGFDPTGGGGLVALLVLICGVALLFTGKYPPKLFDLIVGLNRWMYRVIAYSALMTDVYPPFRLDQGGSESMDPNPSPPEPASTSNSGMPQPTPEAETTGQTHDRELADVSG